jgi:hypothetical protein
MKHHSMLYGDHEMPSVVQSWRKLKEETAVNQSPQTTSLQAVELEDADSRHERLLRLWQLPQK